MYVDSWSVIGRITIRDARRIYYITYGLLEWFWKSGGIECVANDTSNLHKAYEYL